MPTNVLPVIVFPDIKVLFEIIRTTIPTPLLFAMKFPIISLLFDESLIYIPNKGLPSNN